MKTLQRNYLITGIIAVIIAGFGVGAYWRYTAIPSKASIADKPDLVATYDDAIKELAEIKKDPNNTQHYAAAGLDWKGLGDLTNDPKWYRAALRVYQDGIVHTNAKNTLLMANAAVIEIALENYTAAESYYKQAVELSPGEAQYYLPLINLERTKIKASPEIVLAIFDQALSRVINTGEIIIARAQYNKLVGRYDESIADWTTLFNAQVMTKENYDAEIQEINQLKEQSKK